MEPKKKTSKEEEEERLHQFRNDFRNSSKFSNIIDTLIEYADDEVFSDILNLKETQYLDSINSYLKNKLTEIYTKSIFDNNSLNNLISNKIEKVKKNYNSNFKLLNDAYEFFNNLPKKNLTDYYLTDFRKHCYDTQEYCLHSCHSRIKNNLLVVKENKKYLICISCKKVYLNTFIDGYCNSCSVEYKTSILNKNENKMLLPATWKKYHCEEIINEKIKCIKCTKLLYLNFKTQNLDCLNCEFSAKPNRILWTCNIDKVEFKSDAIVYNPLQVEIVKKSINLTLMIKHKAHPNNLSCCPKINVYFQDFYHKKECKGILYLGELRNKLIIVCEKCKSINFYERFIWTCPNCGRRFRDRKSNFRTYKDLVNNDRQNTIEEDNSKEEEEDKKEKSYRDRLRERRERIHNRINEEDDNKLNKSTTFSEGRHVRRSFVNVNKSVDQLYGKDDEDDSNNRTKNRYNRIYHHQTQEIDENDSKIKSHISGRYKNSYRSVNTEIDEDEEDNKKFPSSTRNKRFSYFFLEKEKENKRKKELEEKEKEKEEKEKEREREREREEREKEREKRREQREKERKEREEREEKEREEREKEREKRRLEREREREKERKERERLNNQNTTDDKTHINYQKRYKLKEKEEHEEQDNKEKERQLRRERIEKERQEQKEKEEKLRIEREQREKARRERIEKRKEESNNNNNENDTKSNRHFYHRHTTGDREHISNNNKKNEINDNQTQDKANKKYNKNHSAQTQMEDDSESKTRANTHSPHGGNSLPKEIIKILNEGIIPQINIDDYTILNQVGEGSYGVIYQVKNNHNRKIFALKKEIAHDENEVKLVYEDVKLINSCNHNNVMKIYGITVCPLDVTTFAIYILMEYADDDWDKEIKKNYQNRINYKEDELIKILKQLTSAFRFLQEEKKIAHRDIKPNNILIFNTRGVKEYKIADFGEAKKAKTSKQMNTLRGTELYMSPALYQGLKQDKDDVVYDPYRSDVFSLGYCFLYAGALNIKIILEVRDVDDMGKLEKILRRYFKNKYTERFIQLMLFMLEFDESKRVDFIGLDNYLNENFKN